MKRIPRYNGDGDRRCSRCDQYLPAISFHRNRHSGIGDGLDAYCMDCRNQAASEYHARHRDRRLEQHRAWRKQHARHERHQAKVRRLETLAIATLRERQAAS